MIYRGSIKNGTVVFDEPVPLREGTLVGVEPMSADAARPAPGSGEAMQFLDEITWAGDARELDQLLAEVHAAREMDLTQAGDSNPLDDE